MRTQHERAQREPYFIFHFNIGLVCFTLPVAMPNKVDFGTRVRSARLLGTNVLVTVAQNTPLGGNASKVTQRTVEGSPSGGI